MSRGKLVSNRADFPKVKVYYAPGKQGRPVMTIAFQNREKGQGAIGGLWLLLAIAAVPAGIFFPPLLAAALLLFVMAWRSLTVRTHARSIVLDFDAHEVRVLDGGRVTLRKRAALANVAIEQHPWLHASDPYKRRAGEKQHCLVGYFGAAGADREVLVTRWEWPPVASLQEVQGAIVWADQMATNIVQGAEQFLKPGPAPLKGGNRLGPPLE